MLQHFIQHLGAIDSTGQPTLPPKACEPLDSFTALSRREQVSWFGVETQQDAAEVFGKWHAVNDSRVAVFEQVIRGQSNFRKALSDRNFMVEGCSEA
jgi:hypothetical protein